MGAATAYADSTAIPTKCRKLCAPEFCLRHLPRPPRGEGKMVTVIVAPLRLTCQVASCVFWLHHSQPFRWYRSLTALYYGRAGPPARRGSPLATASRRDTRNREPRVYPPGSGPCE